MRMICFIFVLAQNCFLLAQAKNESFSDKVKYYFDRMHYDSVLSYYAQNPSEEIFTDTIASSFNLVAKCYYYVGQNDASLLTYKRILRNPPHDPEILAAVYCGYAEVLIETAQYDLALQQLINTEKILIHLNRPKLVALYHNSRGVLYLRTSDYSNALHHLDIALQIARKDGEDRLIGQILTSVGIVHYEIGNYQDALEAYEEALHIDLSSQNDKDLAVDYLNIGSVYYRLNDKLKSIEYFQQAKESYTAINDSAGISFVLGNLSTIYIDLKKYGRAAASLTEAVKIAHMSGDQLGEASWLFSLALVDYENGKYAYAYEVLHKVAARFEKLESYIHYGQVLISMGKCKVKLRDYAAAEGLYLLAARTFESRSLQNEIWSVKAGLAKLYTLMNRDWEADIFFQESINAIEDARVELTRDLTTYFIEEDRLDVYRSYVSFLIRHDKNEKAFDILEKAKARNLTDFLQEGARIYDVEPLHSDSSSLLEYFLHTDGSYVFVRLSGDLKVIPIGKKESIHTLLVDYLSQIKQKRNDLNAFLLLSKKLHSEIWEPIEKVIQLPPRLTIIPDGWLHYLPFESLFDGQKYAAEKFEIRYSPSAAVANKLDISAPNTHTANFVTVFSQSRFTDMLHKSVKLEDLMYVELENNHVKKIFQDSAVIYSGKNMRMSVVCDSVLNRSSIIHFAAHGINNLEMPSMSALSLCEADSLSHGLLTASDIQKLHLDRKLIVLSACETSLGYLLHGEGMLGLTRAFMVAGASSVVAATWNVYDKSTAEFMRIFYEKIVTEKLSISKALQMAKIEMIRSKEWKDPVYWSPFVVWGAGN